VFVAKKEVRIVIDVKSLLCVVEDGDCFIKRGDDEY
jgi:hypothetical protein